MLDVFETSPAANCAFRLWMMSGIAAAAASASVDDACHTISETKINAWSNLLQRCLHAPQTPPTLALYDRMISCFSRDYDTELK